MNPPFDDVRRDQAGSYYYDENDVPLINIPVAEKNVGFPLTKKELSEWFGISDDRMQQVPKFLLRPKVSDGKGGNGSGTLDRWTYLQGGMTVCTPIEWVPIVEMVQEHPKSTAKEVLSKESTTINMTTLYAKVQASLGLEGGANYEGMCLSADAKAEGYAETKYSREQTESQKSDITFGPNPIGEVVVGMGIRVKEIYDVYFKNDDVRYETWLKYTFPDVIGTGRSLSWSLGSSWDDIRIPHAALGQVSGLRYKFQDVYLQCLPVVEKGEFKDLHIALCLDEWTDWFAYVDGQKKTYNDIKVLGWLPFKAVTTFMTLSEDPVDIK